MATFVDPNSGAAKRQAVLDRLSAPGIQPVPVANRPAKVAADVVRNVNDFASAPFGFDNPVGKGLASLVGLPSIAKTLDNVAYGMPNTRGSGQARTLRPEAKETLAAVLPASPIAGKAAVQGAKVAGRELGPNAVNMAENYMRRTGGVLDIFAGEGSKTANLPKLAQAKTMQQQGVADPDIYRDTGWFAGMADKKWRYEIPDDKAQLRSGPESTTNAANYVDWIDEASSRENGVRLPLALDHNELFAAYPKLGATRVKVQDKLGGADGAFDSGDGPAGTVRLLDPYSQPASKGLDNRSIMLHELQHGIQGKEGFAAGGNPAGMISQEARPLLDDALGRIEAQMNAARQSGDRKSYEEAYNASTALMDPSGYEAYRRLAGEAEARLVQSRMNFTPEQRAASYPPGMMDVPVPMQIVRFDGPEQAAISQLSKQKTKARP